MNEDLGPQIDPLVVAPPTPDKKHKNRRNIWIAAIAAIVIAGGAFAMNVTKDSKPTRQSDNEGTPITVAPTGATRWQEKSVPGHPEGQRAFTDPASASWNGVSRIPINTILWISCRTTGLQIGASNHYYRIESGQGFDGLYALADDFWNTGPDFSGNPFNGISVNTAIAVC